MRKGRVFEEQTVRILRDMDRESVSKVAKRYAVSGRTICDRRKRYGELEVAAVRGFRGIGAENARLNRSVAERGLEIDVMKDIVRKVVSTKARRLQVVYALTQGLSQRRACGLMSAGRRRLVMSPGLRRGVGQWWESCAKAPDSFPVTVTAASISEGLLRE